MNDQIHNAKEWISTEVEEIRHVISEKPLLRGTIHLGAFIASIVGGVFLVTHARGSLALTAAIIYALGLSLALGTSSLYHRGRWTGTGFTIMQRLDHSMIFVLVASTYTPFLLLAANGSTRTVGMTVVWGLTAAGVVFRSTRADVPRPILVGAYMVLGWIAVALAPTLWQKLPPATMLFVVVGGLLYTAGAAVYLFKRPDPLPRIFGFHEIFHAFTVVAAICHFAAIAHLLKIGVGNGPPA